VVKVEADVAAPHIIDRDFSPSEEVASRDCRENSGMTNISQHNIWSEEKPSSESAWSLASPPKGIKVHTAL